jgi:hypothetical protein
VCVCVCVCVGGGWALLGVDIWVGVSNGVTPKTFFFSSRDGNYLQKVNNSHSLSSKRNGGKLKRRWKRGRKNK